MRLSTEFWVSAYLRQCQLDGDFAGLLRKGASQGGAVCVIVNRLDGTADFYAPAPQALLEDQGDERVFYCLLEAVSEDAIHKQVEKETRFDGDLWLIERESRSAKHGLILSV